MGTMMHIAIHTMLLMSCLITMLPVHDVRTYLLFREPVFTKLLARMNTTGSGPDQTFQESRLVYIDWDLRDYLSYIIKYELRWLWCKLW